MNDFDRSFDRDWKFMHVWFVMVAVLALAIMGMTFFSMYAMYADCRDSGKSIRYCISRAQLPTEVIRIQHEDVEHGP